MTTLAAEPAVLGHTYPRLYTKPLVTGPAGPCGCGCALTPETSFGFDVDDFARDILRKPLDPWQRFIVIHACELLPDGRPRFRQVLALIPRQNGKSWLCVVLGAFWLFVDRVDLVLGTSTKLDYAEESWDKCVKLAQNTPELAVELPKNGVRRANGEQELRTKWGGRYKIAASNEEGGRSLTVHRLVMDELRQHHSWDAYSACVPATTAVRDAQIWMISNMGDDKSVVLNDLRDQATADIERVRMGQRPLDPRLALFEYSSPDGMAATDVEALAMANPNLGRRIDLDSLIGEAMRAQTAGGEQLAKFLTEVHCRRVTLMNPAIDMQKWAECRGDASLDAFRDNIAACLDVSMDEQHAALYAAALDGDKVRVDAVKSWEGPTAVAQMQAELPALVTRVNPRVLGWFPNGPAASVAAALAEKADWPPVGVEVEAIRGEVTAVCMGFAEQVRSLAIVHGDDPLLDAHVGACEKLQQGDGWRFTRKGEKPVNAAYAAAGAVHLARTMEVGGGGVFFV